MRIYWGRDAGGVRGRSRDDGGGRTGPEQPYTAALLTHLEEPLELSALFRRVAGAGARGDRWGAASARICVAGAGALPERGGAPRRRSRSPGRRSTERRRRRGCSRRRCSGSRSGRARRRRTSRRTCGSSRSASTGRWRRPGWRRCARRRAPRLPWIHLGSGSRGRRFGTVRPAGDGRCAGGNVPEGADRTTTLVARGRGTG